MVPKRAFPVRLRLVRDDRLDRLLGSAPVRRLSAKLRVRRDFNDPIKEGMDPVKALSCILNSTSFVKDPSQDGMVPRRLEDANVSNTVKSMHEGMNSSERVLFCTGQMRCAQPGSKQCFTLSA